MTPEKQRIAIAESCGRKPGAYYCGVCRECIAIEEVTSGGYHAKCGGVTRADLPNYADDLNAMHEAEKVIPRELLAHYRKWLRDIVVRDSPGVAVTAIEITLSRWVFHANAAQRAEAFLRTINKWEAV